MNGLQFYKKSEIVSDKRIISANGIYDVSDRKTIEVSVSDWGNSQITINVSGPFGIQVCYVNNHSQIWSPTTVSPGSSITIPKLPFYIKSLSTTQSGGSMTGVKIFSPLDGESTTTLHNQYFSFAVPTSDVINIVVSCFLPDTLITLADGTKKQIKDLTYSDTLRVWDFDTGTYGAAPICWLTRSGLINDHYYKLTFSDGTTLKTTGQNSNHKVYNVDERYFKGVDKTQIGDRIFSENGIVTVTNKEYIEEEVEYYNLMTTGKIVCFAEGILTSDRYGNLYPIDEDMKWVKEGRKIRPYSEFEAVGIKRYWYDTIRLGEVTGTIEDTRAYIDKLECQMLPLPTEE